MRIQCNKKLFISLLIAAIVVVGITLGLVFGLRNSGNNDNIDSQPRAVAAVVSNGRGCAEVGSQILNDGGSAADAGIATLLCEGVILPHSMGIGGGFVATIYTRATRKIETLIAREAAPKAAHKDMFVGLKEIKGARAGAVPGEILGYWELHQKHGRLPWKVLFEPTIKLCKEGHWVSQYLAAAIKSKEEQIRAEPSMAEIFIKPDGTLYVEGDYMKRPQLGATLERIATNGAKEMYGGGETGRMFVEDIQKLGGIITEEDLQSYKVRWEDANHVVANVTGGFTLYTTPLPSSGPVLAFMMNVMNDLQTPDKNVYWHRVIETFKHAYGQRSNLGDMLMEPDLKATIEETFNKLTSQEFANHVRTLIHDDRTFEDIKYYGANFNIEEDHGTANMAVLAPNGDAVSITSTVNNYFGSIVRSSSTGIILNDEMDDFSTPGVVNSFGVPASPANYIYPGKIPMSSMCPSIIVDSTGNVRMLVGAAGGTKITTSVAMTIIKYLIFNEPLSAAINDGRLHHQLVPMRIDSEADVPSDLQNYLTNVGHTVNLLAEGSSFAALTAIGVRDDFPTPMYDRRRVGSVATLLDRNKMKH